jgi:hypothetical protein
MKHEIELDNVYVNTNHPHYISPEQPNFLFGAEVTIGDGDHMIPLNLISQIQNSSRHTIVNTAMAGEIIWPITVE